MRNHVQYSTSGEAELSRLLAAASDPDELEQVVVQLEECLRWYDPRTDPDTTTNCGSVAGPGLLPAPHFTARAIVVAPLRFYFMVNDFARPYFMTIVRVEWVLSAVTGE